jgi:hypothetical protein
MTTTLAMMKRRSNADRLNNALAAANIHSEVHPVGNYFAVRAALHDPHIAQAAYEIHTRLDYEV